MIKLLVSKRDTENTNVNVLSLKERRKLKKQKALQRQLAYEKSRRK